MTDGTAQGSTPLISVIMPTWNRAHTLPRAIRSVLAQSWEHLELIIADDGSTDGTRELVERIPDPRLKYFRHQTNRGAAAARNLGLAHARGEYIAFQDSDDEWLLDKLTMQMDTLRSRAGEFGATFGGKLLYGRDPGGRFGEGLAAYRPDNLRAVRSGRITSQLLEGNLISPQTLLAQAQAVRETGSFDERLPSNEDWEFMLRLSMKTRVLFTNRPVVVAYISGDSISRNRHAHARAFMTITKKHQALFREQPRLYAQKLFTTARYLHQLGRYRSAQKFLLRALEVHPGSVRSWLRLLQARLAAIAAPWRKRTKPGTISVPSLRPVRSRSAGRRRGRAGRLIAFAFSRNEPERHVQRADSR